MSLSPSLSACCPVPRPCPLITVSVFYALLLSCGVSRDTSRVYITLHYNATAASLLLLATAAPPNHAHVISTLLARSQPSPPPAGSACPRSLRNGSANVRQLNTHGPRARPRFDAQPRTVCKEELRWQTDGREDLVEQQPPSGRPPLWRAVRPLAQRGYLLILRGHVSS